MRVRGATFDERRPVRVCFGELDEPALPAMAPAQGPGDVALRVERSGEQAIIVQPGSCAEFAAQTIEVSPEGAVESGWTLTGTIQSRQPEN